MSAMMAAMANHPIAQAIRNFATDVQGTRGPEAAAEDEHTFTPPIDIFTTTDGYVLHIALPGAKKEDVGVNWDADKNELSVAGVVYRPGDEAFLANLTRGERRVGMFERSVRLPPVGVPSEEKEEVDAENITARMEDGVLIVTVPKVEREWTEVRKVDIE
jgi:HSP20 family protein